MFSTILSILAPVFITVLIGYCWSKSGRAYDTDLITSIVTYFGTPCLVFYSLSSVDLQPELLGQMVIAALVANAVFILLGGVILKTFQLPLRAYLQVLSFPNIGNVGLPLCLFAFGDTGLALGIAFFAVYAVFQMTVGVAFVAGSFSLKDLFQMPVIPATLLAVFFFLSQYSVPEWLHNTTKLIGDLTIPLMLITLGVTLAKLQVHHLKVPIFLSCLRLIMGFVVGVGIAATLH
ncbi:MAG: AEC family transporter, partial [Desulfobacteraceae bacterium]|nr:AEC family transporter [Desulfobacteraceae bacterium]